MSRIFDSTLTQRQPLACSILQSAVQRQRLGQAYLLSGRAEQDKWDLSRQLASYLNCSDEHKGSAGSCCLRAASGYPGQPCSNCRWITDEAHPQAWLILSGQDSKSGRIAVEKARQLSDELARTSQYFRVVVVPKAAQDIFHRPAANALLKTIEEPGAHTVFLLFASQPEEVLSTIVSRCQVIALSAALSLQSIDEATHGKLQDFNSRLKQPPLSHDFTSIRSATCSLASTLEWSRRLYEIAEAEEDGSAVIDLVVQQEFGSLRSSAASDPALSWYLNSLLDLAEVTKDQIEHYVQLKAALDSFALCCRALSQAPSGESRVEQN